MNILTRNKSHGAGRSACAELLAHASWRYHNLKYVNAKDVLPPDILAEVQKYTGGALIYVPKDDSKKVAWGQHSGARAQMFTRNRKIAEAHQQGATIYDLMSDYCLSESSIRKIIYAKNA